MEWSSMEVSVRDELKVRALKLNKKKRKNVLQTGGGLSSRKERQGSNKKCVRVGEWEKERGKEREKRENIKRAKEDLELCG